MAAWHRHRVELGAVPPGRWVFVSRFVWVAICGAVVAAVVGVFMPQINRCRALSRRAVQENSEMAAVQARINELEKKQKDIDGDRDFVERLAREELGLAKEGETVYKFIPQGYSTLSLDPATNSARHR